MLRSYSLLTPQCSTIGDAELNDPLPTPALSPARAPQARTAHTPHGSLRAPQARTPPPAPRHTDEVYFPRYQPLTNSTPLSSNPNQPLTYPRLTHKNLWSLSLNKECIEMHDCGDPKTFLIFWESGATPSTYY